MAKVAKKTTPATEAAMHPLGDNAGKAIAAAVNAILADSFALYMKTKNFHWHVAGPHFREYHLLLDEQAAQILAMTDPVAERVRKLGQRTLTSIGAVAKASRISDNDATGVPALAMLTELLADNRVLAGALREAKELCDEHGDIATSAMIDVWTDETERRAWFLTETLQPAA